MNKVLALILAGGVGSRLSILSEERAKPAVPFAGKYRIIDFTLSNCVNSGLLRVGVLTQYRPRSLNDHIGIGRAWDLDHGKGGVFLLQPYTGRRASDWYRGTGDAVYQNLYLIEEEQVDEVLILAGDHIYRMRYDAMLNFHRAKGADCTVGMVEVPFEEASRYGIAALDDDGRIVDWAEKPSNPKSNLASMGIYVFNADRLRDSLVSDARNVTSIHDFGTNIIPELLAEGRKVYGYKFKGYWRDVGTVESYWQANMEFLEDPPPLALEEGDERVRTPAQDRPPARMTRSSEISRSLICHGCVVRGTVKNSVLSQGVVVEEGAVVEDSIIFEDTIVKRGARVHYSIIDKEVVIGEGAIVGSGDDLVPNVSEPKNLQSGITLVGKRAVVPAGIVIGRNCKVAPGTRPLDYPDLKLLPSGSTVEPPKAATPY